MANNISCVNNCTGCGLCAHICPKGAIEIKEDILRDHFLYPCINNDQCINCGLCLKTCPSTKKGTELKNNHCFLFKHNNEDKLINSSSGGAFQVIAEQIFKNNKSSVYGAAWNGLKVSHIRITSVHDLNKLLGSKYIQSYISKEIYKNIKDDLINGNHVLFCGTPCQVAAVDAYLPEGLKMNLILVQILCHGVPNQWGFDKCIEHENRLIHGKINMFEFRHKVSVGTDNRKFIYNYAKSNKTYQVIGDYFFFPYYRLFHTYSIYRDSCYHCDYRKHRFGDLIVGDFWGISSINRNYKNDYDKSLIIALSEKGNAVFRLIDVEYICDLNNIAKYNESIFNDVEPKREYADFYNKISDINFYRQYRIKPNNEKAKAGLRNFAKRILNLLSKKSKRKLLTKITYNVKCVK